MDNRMIPFIDLSKQQERLRPEIEAAFSRILDHGGFIMGPEVYELEKQLSAFCAAQHTLSCSNGTDALAIVLRAKNVGPGDAIFVPSFTFAATAEVVDWMGATPVFIDVLPDTFNMDSESLIKGIGKVKTMNLNPRGIIAVDIFGQAADYDTINDIAKVHDLWVMADAAQSFGGTYKGRKIGTLADTTTTSFYPAKPLGAYGDAGAVFTHDQKLNELMQSIRVHGQGNDKYQNVRIGINGRCDTIQAAILLAKLSIFPEEIELRQKAANRYNEGLSEVAVTPYVAEHCQSTWAQYTIKVKPENRQDIIDGLKAQGVPTMIHYTIPLHRQLAYKHYPCATDTLPVCDALSHSVLSLPMHPYLEADIQDHIIKSFCDTVHKLGTKKVA